MKFKIKLSKLYEGKLVSQDHPDCGCAVGQALLQCGVPKKLLVGKRELGGWFPKHRLTQKLVREQFLEAQKKDTWIETDWLGEAYHASDHLTYHSRYEHKQVSLIEQYKRELKDAFKQGGHTITFVK